MLAWFALTIGAVLVMRFIEPPTTAFAVIAAEDQKLASHHIFDFDQIADALDERLEHHAELVFQPSDLSAPVARNIESVVCSTTSRFPSERRRTRSACIGLGFSIGMT